MGIFITHSYPIATIILGLFILVITSRITQINRPMQLGIMLVYAMVAIFVWTAFNYPESPIEVATVADVENTLINEKPTFVMLYSNY
jgi:hypothetical protein